MKSRHRALLNWGTVFVTDEKASVDVLSCEARNTNHTMSMKISAILSSIPWIRSAYAFVLHAAEMLQEPSSCPRLHSLHQHFYPSSRM